MFSFEEFYDRYADRIGEQWSDEDDYVYVHASYDDWMARCQREYQAYCEREERKLSCV